MEADRLGLGKVERGVDRVWGDRPLGAGASLEGVSVLSTAVHYSAEWTSAVPAAPTRNIGGDERGQDSVNRIIKSKLAHFVRR